MDRLLVGMVTRFFLAALVAAFVGTPCLAQTGTVIFYTDAYSAKNSAAALLPKSQQPFSGWLFDGPQRLAHVRPGRFMAFDLKAGAHSFTAPWRSSHPCKETLVVNVEIGERYCVHLYAKMTNFEVIPVELLHSKIEEVTCELAQQNAVHLKPIEIKRVDVAVRSELDASTSFSSYFQPPQ